MTTTAGPRFLFGALFLVWSLLFFFWPPFEWWRFIGAIVIGLLGLWGVISGFTLSKRKKSSDIAH